MDLVCCGDTITKIANNIYNMGEWTEKFEGNYVGYLYNIEDIRQIIYREYGRWIDILSTFDPYWMKTRLCIEYNHCLYIYSIPQKRFEQLSPHDILRIIRDWVEKTTEEPKTKPPLGKLRPVPTCVNCGGKINLKTLTCEFCKTEYYFEGE
jgi:hypothetical protein